MGVRSRPVNRRRTPAEQLPLPARSPPKRRAGQTPEQIAKVAIARRAKPSAVSGNVKLTLTFNIPRELAERLSARGIREGVNLEAVIIAHLKRGEAASR